MSIPTAPSFLIFITALDAFTKYKRATGAVADSATGLLRITQAQYNSLQNLNFNIGGTTYSLTPNAQIWPVSTFSQSTPSTIS